MGIEQYLVLGNPVMHSKSPMIHRRFAEQTGEALRYDRRLVETGTFEKAIRAIQQEGIAGANITLPFKEEAYRIADESSSRADRAGAVNTLTFRKDGSIHGDNTDGVGMVRDITENHGQILQDKRILILGAGGAVRGILKPVIDQKPHSITIANRTVTRAEQLRDLFADEFKIGAGDFACLTGQQFDVVINGTSLGLQGKVAPIPDEILVESAIAYDMMYGEGCRPFRKWALARGIAITMDGLGMLVEQAAESFYLWRHVYPQTRPVIEQIRATG